MYKLYNMSDISASSLAKPPRAYTTETNKGASYSSSSKQSLTNINSNQQQKAPQNKGQNNKQQIINRLAHDPTQRSWAEWYKGNKENFQNLPPENQSKFWATAAKGTIDVVNGIPYKVLRNKIYGKVHKKNKKSTNNSPDNSYHEDENNNKHHSRLKVIHHLFDNTKPNTNYNNAKNAKASINYVDRKFNKVCSVGLSRC